MGENTAANELYRKLGMARLLATSSVNEIARLCPETLATGNIERASILVFVGLTMAYCLFSEHDSLDEIWLRRFCGDSLDDFLRDYSDCLNTIKLVADQHPKVNPFEVIAAWVISRLSRGQEGAGAPAAETFVKMLICNMCRDAQ